MAPHVLSTAEENGQLGSVTLAVSRVYTHVRDVAQASGVFCTEPALVMPLSDLGAFSSWAP